MQLFQRIGAQMLPFAFILQPSTAVDQERIRIKDADKLKPETMEHFPWTVSEFDAFLVDRTGISIGKVCLHPLLHLNSSSPSLTTVKGPESSISASLFVPG